METKLFTYLRTNQYANMDTLERMIMRGFNPKWYVVLHFNDGAASTRQQQRRLDDDEVNTDLEVVKDQPFILNSMVVSG